MSHKLHGVWGLKTAFIPKDVTERFDEKCFGFTYQNRAYSLVYKHVQL